jgi:HlyD family secretion protein
MNKPTKRILLILLGALATGLLALAFRPQPVLIEVAEVTRGHFEQTVEDDGKTRVRERYVVSAPLAGKLKRIELKAGDKVNRGALLALIEPSIPALLDVRTERELTERLGAAEATRQRSAATVARAQATLDKSRADLARARKLAASGFVSPTQAEQAELELKINVRELEAAQFAEHAAGHDVETARAALLRAREGAASGKPSGRRWEVRSPVAGQVLKVIQESETALAIGAPLLEIGDPADLEVVVDLLSTDAVQVRPGNTVRIERWGRAEPLEGRVRRVEPSAFTKISALGVEEQRVNVVIDLNPPAGKWQSLGDGYRVDARIIVASLDNVVKVPVAALFRAGDQWAVFTLSGGRASKRIVNLARRGSLEAMVADGLQPGEKVIVHPGDAVKEGSRVKVR